VGSSRAAREDDGVPRENGPEDSRPSTALGRVKSIETVFSPPRFAAVVLGVLHRAEYWDGEAIDPELKVYEEDPDPARSPGNSRRPNPSGLGVGSCLVCGAVYGELEEPAAAWVVANEFGRCSLTDSSSSSSGRERLRDGLEAAYCGLTGREMGLK
jgi:hypothetical protein